MAISRPTCCTREQAMLATDITETTLARDQVDRAIEAATDAVELLCHRSFHPTLATRYFPWPQRFSDTHRLWLDQDEVISVTSLVAGGVTIPSTDYFLEPANDGPPYHSIEIDLGSNAAFSYADTSQRAIAVTGVFGFDLTTSPAGALAEALDASETGVDVTDSAAVGVGDLIVEGTEQMLVVEKSMLDTTFTVGGAGLTDSKASVSLTVSGGTFPRGELLLIGAEKMRVDEQAGTLVTVRRATDGSVLAAHSAGAAIFAPRTLTVVRGALGTTAATHSQGAALARHVVPGAVRDLALAEAVVQIQTEQSGYARTAGSGDNMREVGSGKGLADKRTAVAASHGRIRLGAI